MHQIAKRGLALLMALIMCIGLLPVMNLRADATEIEYVYDSTNKYIYNWGSRGETATSLSPKAEEFYTDTTYTELSQLSGGTSTSDAPNSALYSALKELMVDKHTHQTSYNETRDLYQYTDCQNNVQETDAISCFYTGNDLGPAWDSGATWNREHTWPDSKGAGGNDENDIMMLRPTASNVNSSRGNKAYGESSGYYNPNSASNNTLDLRGDVARIFLYVYVRWGIVNGNGQANASGTAYTTWGSNGVMESLEVLLKWMAADPVDTWELGRNDSVQAITGTRNVFVDYPELAFLLFGADMPANMPTPSGEAMNADTCQHNYVAGTPVAPTCTEEGYTVYTCSLCSKSYKGDKTPATGHSYEDGKCKTCGEAEPATPVEPTYVTEIATNTAYKLGLYSTNKNATYYFLGTMSGYYGATDTAYDKGVDMFVEETAGGYYLYFINSSNTKQYINLVQSGTYYNFTYGTTAASVFSWDTDKDALYTTVGSETCYMGTYGTYVTMGVLRDSKMQTTDYIARMYTMDSGETPCEHLNTENLPGKDATCGEPGLTEGKKCTDCGATLTAQQEIPATGEHTYVGGVCTGCGKEEPTGAEVTITFDDVSKRAEFTSSIQVWQENGITVTNEKSASTTAVGDYSKPARFYAGSNLKIEFPGMTQIVFNCNNNSYAEYSYADELKNSIGSMSGVTVTVDGLTVTVEFAEAQDSLFIAKLTKQIRMDSITVYAAGGETPEPECQHTNTTVEGAVPATCTTDGHTGKTVCVDCRETLDEGEVIPAAHTEETVSGKAATCTESGLTDGVKCSVCGVVLKEQEEIPATGHTEEPVPGKDATCTEAGLTDGVKCSVCGVVLKEQEEIPATGHNYEAVVTEPTCNLIGYTTHTCAGCGDSYVTDEVRPTGHLEENREEKPYVAPTQTEAGYTAGVYCNGCGTYLYGHEQIPALGYTVRFIVPATVTAVAPITGTTVVLPIAEAPAGFAFVGWVTETVKDSQKQPEVLHYAGEELTVSADTVLYALYSYAYETPAAAGTNSIRNNVTFTTNQNVAMPYSTGNITASKSIADLIVSEGWTDSTIKQTFKLDNVVTVKIGGGANSGKAYNGNHIRLYATDTPAGSMTITLAEGYELVSVKISTQTGTYAFLCVGNGTTDISNVTTAVSGSSVVLNAVKNGSNGKQVRVTAIEVIYTQLAGGCDHQYDEVVTAPTCTEDGYITYTCSLCGDSYKGAGESATGHSYANGACTVCGEAEPVLPTWTKVELADIKATDIIAITMTKGSTTWALYNANGTGSAPTAVVVTVNGNTMTSADADTLSWNISNTDGTLIIYKAGSTTHWLYSNNDNNGTRVGTNSNKTWVVDASSGYLKHVGTNRYLGVYTSNPDWRAYTSINTNITGQTLSFWKLNTGEEEPECQHTNTTIEGDQKATCTTDGHTGKTVCVDCGEILDEGEAIPATGEHTYVGGVCTGCGEAAPAVYTTVIGKCAHEITHLDGVAAATCTTDGNTGNLVCDACGETVSQGKAILAQHIWTEATCMNAKICGVCGETNGEPLAHTPGQELIENEVAADCVTDGSYDKVHYCTICGEEASRETVPVPATGHTPSEPAIENEVAPTCTADGSYDSVVYCSVCTAEISRETVPVPATGHTPSEPVIENEVAPTCTADGSYDSVVYCSVCKAEISRETVPVFATGHDYQAVVTAPTCSENGYTTYTCSVCGDSYVADKVPATGAHTFGAWNVLKAATCTEGGMRTRSCVCGASQTEMIVATGVHAYSAWTETKAATCTEEGEKTRSCDCGDVQTAAIAALGHTEVVDAAVAATCTTAGKTEGKHCDLCNEVLTAQEEIPALGHSEVTDAGKTATCTTAGKTEGKHCSVCGEVLVAQEVIAATGHSFGDWKVSKEATRTEAGEETRSCACGETETREIPALGGVNPVPVVIVVVAGLGAVAVVAFVFMKKKRA